MPKFTIVTGEGKNPEEIKAQVAEDLFDSNQDEIFKEFRFEIDQLFRHISVEAADRIRWAVHCSSDDIEKACSKLGVKSGVGRDLLINELENDIYTQMNLFADWIGFCKKALIKTPNACLLHAYEHFLENKDEV